MKPLMMPLMAALMTALILPLAAPAWAQSTTTTAPAPAAKKKAAKPKTPAPKPPAQPVEAPPTKPGVAKADPKEEAEAKRYLACLESAKHSPAIALQSADAWRTQGGGAPALHCAAVSLFEMKRYQEAALRFESLADATPKPDVRMGALEQASQAWFLAGRPEMAEKQLDTALTLKPGDPELLIDRGIFRANLGRLEEAIGDWTEALKKAPDRDDVLALRATALRKTNQPAAARADADRAIAINPKNVDALLERGTLRQMGGDTGGAIEDWNAVKTLAPDSPAAHTADSNLARAAAAAPK
ncbi:MAG: tetratricopeptide repeat protein [Alphaproteobacteria bacterium]